METRALYMAFLLIPTIFARICAIPNGKLTTVISNGRNHLLLPRLTLINTFSDKSQKGVNLGLAHQVSIEFLARLSTF